MKKRGVFYEPQFDRISVSAHFTFRFSIKTKNV